MWEITKDKRRKQEFIRLQKTKDKIEGIHETEQSYQQQAEAAFADAI